MLIDTQKHEVPRNLRSEHAERHVCAECQYGCGQAVDQTSGGHGVTLHDVLVMPSDMWSTRCRDACVRSHARRHTGCHTAFFENSYSTRFEFTSKRGSARIKISSEVGLLVKVKKGFGTQKTDSGSRPQSTKNSEFPLLGSWIMAGGQG
ncbi:hypothetical protein IGI04_006705 [Brassica rapa subsp. trilocularis]|uniref:Uncharacterized protein n=1 Tax=Brassica rapa subsp. trilocularis TaxID=1813537 RepID=A0ABQ7NHN1_BRACM|nr:hypothetical protein IGI04_006705 [Brassica rapa subsp. trilocularis]